MAKRRNPMPLAISQDETGLAVAHMGAVAGQMPPANARGRKSPSAATLPRPSGGTATERSRSDGDERQEGGWNGQSDPDGFGRHLIRQAPMQPMASEHGLDENQRHTNGSGTNGQRWDDQSLNPQAQDGARKNAPQLESKFVDDVRMLIRDHRLDEASRAVSTLLDHRIAAGDRGLHAVMLLLQHYDVVLSRQPPLSHIGTVPLRPNDRLYACFDQFIDLIRQQQNQVSELQAIIAELV